MITSDIYWHRKNSMQFYKLIFVSSLYLKRLKKLCSVEAGQPSGEHSDCIRPDITIMVDWAFKINRHGWLGIKNQLSIYVPHFFACSSDWPQRLQTPFAGTGHIYHREKSVDSLLLASPRPRHRNWSKPRGTPLWSCVRKRTWWARNKNSLVLVSKEQKQSSILRDK